MYWEPHSNNRAIMIDSVKTKHPTLVMMRGWPILGGENLVVSERQLGKPDVRLFVFPNHPTTTTTTVPNHPTTTTSPPPPPSQITPPPPPSTTSHFPKNYSFTLLLLVEVGGPTSTLVAVVQKVPNTSGDVQKSTYYQWRCPKST